MKFITDYNKTAIKYEGRDISYREMIEGAKSYGEHLEIEREDRVIIFMENRPELLYAFLAVWDRKGACVCLDEGFDTKELEYYLRDADARYIFTSNKNLETTREAIAATGVELKVLVVEELNEGEKKLEAGELWLEHPDREAVALMLYTSGTTGDPKGVMLTYDNILANLEGLEPYKMYEKTDVVLAILPMHHIFPLLGSGIVPLFKGGTVVFLKEMSKTAIGECLQKNGITMIIGVPRLYEMFHRGIMEKIEGNRVAKILFKVCERAGSLNFSKKIFKKVHEGFGGRIKFFVSGGSKLEPQIAKDFLTLGLEVIEGYGMTETAPMISFTPRGHVVPGSAGIVLPGTELKIGEDGEILSRGRHIMKGYFNKPEATAETVVDGWIHTGDLGELRDGKLYVTGRKKEMIVLSTGKNINPLEIEASILKKSNLIQEIAVTEYNNLLTAVIYPNFQAMKDEGITNIRETLKWGAIDEYNNEAPTYRKILGVEVVGEELPKTKLGKVRRFMLKDFLDGMKREEVEVEEPDFEEYRVLADYLKKVKSRGVVPGAHLELDLGLDSLELVELLSFLEHTFKIPVAENLLLEHSTVESLAEYLAANRKEITYEKINWREILTKTKGGELPTPLIRGGLVKFFTWLPLKYYVDLRLKGIENIPDKPCILAGNHQSFLDGFMLNSILPPHVRGKTYYMAINIHFEGRIKRFAAENGNIILVNLNKNIKESLQKAAEILQSGGNLVIFPEGARTRDGRIGEFKKTFAILARELEVPVVTFGIRGAYDLMPYGSRVPKRGPVDIEFFEETLCEERSTEDFNREVRDRIKEWLEKK